jgi:hypothetical protein
VSSNPDQLYTQALEAQDRGDWQRVIILCGQLLKLQPSHPGAVQLLAQARDALRRRRGAEAESPPPQAAAGPRSIRPAPTPVDETPPPEVVAWYEQGVAAFARNDWALATVALGLVTRAAPRYRDAAVLHVQAQARLGAAPPTDTSPSAGSAAPAKPASATRPPSEPDGTSSPPGATALTPADRAGYDPVVTVDPDDSQEPEVPFEYRVREFVESLGSGGRGWGLGLVGLVAIALLVLLITSECVVSPRP